MTEMPKSLQKKLNKLDDNKKQMIRTAYPNHLSSLSMQLITKELEAQNKMDEMDRKAHRLKEIGGLRERWMFMKYEPKLPTKERMHGLALKMEDWKKEIRKEKEQISIMKSVVKDIKNKLDDSDPFDLVIEDEERNF